MGRPLRLLLAGLLISCGAGLLASASAVPTPATTAMTRS